MGKIRGLLRGIYKKYFQRDLLGDLIKNGLVVGKNFSIENEVMIDEKHCWHITIGDDVRIEPRSHILAHDASMKLHPGYTKIGKTTIGNRVFIGASVIVLPGVNIGDDVIVGVGSIVTTDIPSGSVAVGSPAKVIGSIDEFLEKKKKEIEKYPCFGEEYTMRGGVTEDMKAEMNRKMEDRFGYIV